MRQRAFIVGLFSLLAFGSPLWAEPDSKDAAARQSADDPNQPSAAERQRRHEFIKALVNEHTVVAVDRGPVPLALTDEPVLRYTNPVRNFFTDGSVFLWLEHERPLAAAAPSIRGKGNVFLEFSSFTGRPLECRRQNAVVWAPRSGNLVEQSLAGAATPDASKKVRLRQMRDAARRFRVVTKSEPDVELRLMSQPIYRYAAEGDRVLDGAVFAFVEATDPDFLLVVEAHREGAAASEWRYTLARLCSRPVEVSLDGKPVWSGAGYWANPRALSDPYAEMSRGSYPR